jgi:hypothetical protein
MLFHSSLKSIYCILSIFQSSFFFFQIHLRNNITHFHQPLLSIALHFTFYLVVFIKFIILIRDNVFLLPIHPIHLLNVRIHSCLNQMNKSLDADITLMLVEKVNLLTFNSLPHSFSSQMTSNY